MRRQGFGMVAEAPTPPPSSPAAEKKKKNWGKRGDGEGENVDPSPSSHSAPVRQRHPTVPGDASTRHCFPFTGNPVTATHSHGPPHTLTEGHHCPRGHTTQPHSFTAPFHRDAQHSRPVTQRHTVPGPHNALTHATQHTQPRGCADIHRHIKERTRRLWDPQTLGQERDHPAAQTHERIPNSHADRLGALEHPNAPLECGCHRRQPTGHRNPQVQPPMLAGLGRAAPRPGDPPHHHPRQRRPGVRHSRAGVGLGAGLRRR